jgi:hypothetical protein
MDAIGSSGVDSMSLQRQIKRSASFAAAALLGAAPFALAQSVLIGQPRVMAQSRGAQLFEWTGQVDREVQVVMRGSTVWTNNVGQTERPHARTRSYNRLPAETGQVLVQRLDGRGRVDVIQQPSRQNNYTTIVRIIDDRSGSSNYRVAAYWQGYGNGDVYGRGNGDIYRRRDRDDDGRYGRGNGPGNGRGNGRGNGGWDRGRASEALHWSGSVDGDLEIRIQNGRVDYRNLSGARPTNVRSNVGELNTRQSGALAVQINQGRGDVDVVQQPQQWNGYTTIVRVRDPQGGYGYYDFSLVRR